ncbi:murein biosynthesis integral membrane protein MurJ [Paenibacillus sp. CC-CFT747]|nr:murein biosynthesis integral membrane protein MurJ [Paenibacillus sp. CC-CFT747]
MSRGKAASNTSVLFLITMALAVVAKLSGMIREVIIGWYYGTGAELDLFYYIYSIPELFMTGITAAVAVAVIPFLRAKQDPDFAANKAIVSQVIVIGTLFFAAVTAAALLLHKPILAFYLAKFDTPVTGAYGILLVSCLQIVPTFLCAILLAVETKLEKFKTITLLSLPLNLASVLVMALLNQPVGVLSIGIGLLAGVLLQLGYLFWDLRREGIRYELKLNRPRVKEAKFYEFLLLLLPVYFGTVVQRAGVFIDRYLAAGLEEGSISALSYADRIIQMAVMIIVSTIGMILFSKISHTIHHDEEGTVELLGSTIVFSCLTILPVSAFLAVFSGDITQLLFGRGQFDEKGLQMTSIALTGYSIGLFGIGMRYILNRVYFAQYNVRVPTINTIQALVINVVLSVVLCRYYGLLGIAIAGSVTMLLSSIMLAVKLEKSFRFLSRMDWKDAARSFLLSLILLTVWLAVKQFVLPGVQGTFVRLAISGAVGALVFVTGAKLLGIREFGKLTAAFGRKFKWSKSKRSGTVLQKG